MRVKIFLFIIFIIFLCISSVYSQEKMRLAIMDLQPQNLDKATAIMVSDLLRTELFNTGLFRIIERTEMDAILKEQEFQASGCTETECAVQIGRLLSAHKILVGTIGKLGEKYIINARIVDIERGEMEFGDKAEAASLGDLSSAVEEFANKLAGRISGRVTKQPAYKPEVPVYKPTIPEMQVQKPITPKKIKLGKIFGEIIKKEGNEGIINIGYDNGVKRKNEFAILEPVKTRSPITGEEMIKGYKEIGTLKINYVEKNAAKGELNDLITKDIVGKKIKFIGITINEIGLRGNVSSDHYFEGNSYEVYFRTGQQDKGGGITNLD